MSSGCVDRSGRDILSLVDRSQGANRHSATCGAGAARRASHPSAEDQREAQDDSTPLQRLLQTPERSARVRRRTRSCGPAEHGESRGTLLFGRFIDERELARAREISQLPVQFHRTARSVQRLPAEAAAMWSSDKSGGRRLFLPVDEQTMQVYALLSDIDGAPAAIVQTKHRAHACWSSGSAR